MALLRSGSDDRQRGPVDVPWRFSGAVERCRGAVLVRRSRFAWAGTALVTLAAAVALVSWMGGQRVESRMATIWKGEAMQQSRLPLWTDSWPLVLEFPLLGTGYGTFSYVEPLHRAAHGFHLRSRTCP